MIVAGIIYFLVYTKLYVNKFQKVENIKLWNLSDGLVSLRQAGIQEIWNLKFEIILTPSEIRQPADFSSPLNLSVQASHIPYAGHLS